jgi:hypothetical protein
MNRTMPRPPWVVEGFVDAIDCAVDGGALTANRRLVSGANASLV